MGDLCGEATVFWIRYPRIPREPWPNSKTSKIDAVVVLSCFAGIAGKCRRSFNWAGSDPGSDKHLGESDLGGGSWFVSRRREGTGSRGSKRDGGNWSRSGRDNRVIFLSLNLVLFCQSLVKSRNQMSREDEHIYEIHEKWKLFENVGIEVELCEIGILWTFQALRLTWEYLFYCYWRVKIMDEPRLGVSLSWHVCIQ